MNRQRILAITSASVFLIIILASLSLSSWRAGEITEIGMHQIGLSLFEDYGITFLIIGILMFVAMLGGVFLAKEESK
ncbi:MAG: NADH-quinone oxidoreductase subunit J [Methanomassiliicoccales archaeon]|jgi:NADH:ubiquinone oxidoreductase subunit 6 (subunit J)|nr:NADH-quinone oxidoreductase subunit J [Methanomassiliicoccales archaeon]